MNELNIEKNEENNLKDIEIKEKRRLWLNSNPKFKIIEESKIPKLVNNRKISLQKKVLEYYRYADEILEIAKPVMTCKKGCSDCCNQRVDLSQEEALIILKSFKKANAEKLMNELLDIGSLPNYTQYTTQCPFLINNSCSIYNSRPMYCRTAISFQPNFYNCSKSKEHLMTYTKIEFSKEVFQGSFGRHFEIRQIYHILKNNDII